MTGRDSSEFARSVLQLLFLGTLIAATLWVLRPFLVALTWATTIAVATWPVLLRVQSGLGGRRSLAAASMTLALLMMLVVPLLVSIGAIVGSVDSLASSTELLTTLSIPRPPAWVQSLPTVGATLASRWQQLAEARPEDLAAQLSPYLRTLLRWFAARVGGLGLLFVQFLLTVVACAILYANGEKAAQLVLRFARRLAGERGEAAVSLAGQAIRSVALGIVVTAVLQTVASGLGLVIAGVPLATVLTGAIFILCVAQIGPLLVLIPAVVWVYSTKGAAWGTALLVWSLACGTFDNILRPMLIRRGADLPLLMIFAGVIGGLIAFGVIGLFIGPVVLAVTYTLLLDWISEEEPAR